MKKVLNIVCLIFALLFGTLVLTGCREEKEVMYEKDGFYLPVETQGYDVTSAILETELTSSKIVATRDEEALHQILTLFCSKEPESIGTMSKKKFSVFYIRQEKTKGFFLTLYFSSIDTSETIAYNFFTTTQGALYYGNESKNLYRYTENNFIDVEAISIFFKNWKN